jgi:hypothetical protein
MPTRDPTEKALADLLRDSQELQRRSRELIETADELRERSQAD